MSQRMKVLIDRRLPVRGVKRYSEELTEALRGLNEKIEIEIFGPGGLAVAPFTSWGRRQVGRRARLRGADLIHGTHFEVPPSPIPSVVTVQDLIPLEHPASMPNPIKRTVFRRMVSSSISFSRRVIVSSDAVRESLIRFGVEESKLNVVPLWVSPVFRPLTKEQSAQARARFAGGRRYLAALYHPRAHKNLATLIAAAPVITRQSGLAVVIAGMPKEQTGILSAETLSDDDLRHFFAGAELFVLPSTIEGFGLPAVESLACGTPVVCGSNVGALPYCHEGVAIANVTDPEVLAGKILELAGDDKTIRRLSEAGIAQVAKLSPRTAAEKTYRVYLEALEDS